MLIIFTGATVALRLSTAVVRLSGNVPEMVTWYTSPVPMHSNVPVIVTIPPLTVASTVPSAWLPPFMMPPSMKKLAKI